MVYTLRKKCHSPALLDVSTNTNLLAFSLDKLDTALHLKQPIVSEYFQGSKRKKVSKKKFYKQLYPKRNILQNSCEEYQDLVSNFKSLVQILLVSALPTFKYKSYMRVHLKAFAYDSSYYQDVLSVFIHVIKKGHHTIDFCRRCQHHIVLALGF